jgi:glutathione peroxidase
MATETTLADFVLPGIDGWDLPLDRFAGEVVLIVNVASYCGLTPQYAGLEALFRRYNDRGFQVIGVPCNQFAGQEPGTEAEIQQFCTIHYDVTFPMSGKIEVNGPNRHPLYAWLAGPGSIAPGDVRWNFEKFLIGRDGRLIARFPPTVAPEDPQLQQAIEKALAQ